MGHVLRREKMWHMEEKFDGRRDGGKLRYILRSSFVEPSPQQSSNARLHPRLESPVPRAVRGVRGRTKVEYIRAVGIREKCRDDEKVETRELERQRERERERERGGDIFAEWNER